MTIEKKIQALKDFFAEKKDATREELMRILGTNSVHYFRQILTLARLAGLKVKAVKTVIYTVDENVEGEEVEG